MGPMRRTTAIDEPTKRQLAPVQSTLPRLIVVWPDGSKTLELAPFGTLVIGRAAEADVPVDHTSVSRKHVRLHAGASFAVEDLGSSNGTWLGGHKLAPHVVTPWPSGALLQAGSASFFLQLGPPVAGPDGALPAARKMDAAMQLVELVAPARISVIIEGETGVGKQVVADRIHARSPRASAPFVSINCAALPDALLESELFGFEKGAFTGAAQTKPGLLESADGGTVLLDEVGEMPLATQAKLLRVLETREVQRLGAVRPRPLDVRFIAATNKNLAADVASGKFRADLYYRLNGVTITTPPLRERQDEIPHLLQIFLERTCEELGRKVPELAPGTLKALQAHGWPGNVRELKNVTERAVLLARGGALEPLHFGLLRGSEHGAPAPATDGPREAPGEVASLKDAVSEVEKARIIAALNETGGNQTRAAKLLGISRRSLLDRLDAHGVRRPQKGTR
jgi:two-component system, NtrC family, response regulator AtoC